MAAITNTGQVEAYLTGGAQNPAQTRDALAFVRSEITNNAIKNHKINDRMEKGIYERMGFAATLIVLGSLITASVFSGGIALGVIMALAGAILLGKAVKQWWNANETALPLATNQAPLFRQEVQLANLAAGHAPGLGAVGGPGVAAAGYNNPYAI